MKKILLCISFAFFLTSGSTAATATPKFADYAVAIKHNMITKLPDFNGRDRGAKAYRTRIINGLKS